MRYRCDVHGGGLGDIVLDVGDVRNVGAGSARLVVTLFDEGAGLVVSIGYALEYKVCCPADCGEYAAEGMGGETASPLLCECERE